MRKLAYLEAIRKDKILKSLETGDLVKFNADVAPWIYHFAIVEKENEELFIYHTQRKYLNKLGGSLVRENLKEYLKGRDLILAEKTNLTKSNLHEIIEKLKDKKYSAINNNCEHFINVAKNNKYISPQVATLGALLLITASIVYINIKK